MTLASEMLDRYPGYFWYLAAAYDALPPWPDPCGFCGAATEVGCKLCEAERTKPVNPTKAEAEGGGE